MMLLKSHVVRVNEVCYERSFRGSEFEQRCVLISIDCSESALRKRDRKAESLSILEVGTTDGDMQLNYGVP